MDSTEPVSVRDAKLQALRLASKLAESQESPLAVDQWNAACRRIGKLISSEIKKIEEEQTVR